MVVERVKPIKAASAAFKDWPRIGLQVAAVMFLGLGATQVRAQDCLSYCANNICGDSNSSSLLTTWDGYTCSSCHTPNNFGSRYHLTALDMSRVNQWFASSYWEPETPKSSSMAKRIRNGTMPPGEYRDLYTDTVFNYYAQAIEDWLYYCVPLCSYWDAVGDLNGPDPYDPEQYDQCLGQVGGPCGASCSEGRSYCAVNLYIPSNPTYEDHVWPILAKHCINCHGEGRKFYYGGAGPLTEFGPNNPPSKSQAYDRVTKPCTDPNHMPKDRPMLHPDDIEVINRWAH